MTDTRQPESRSEIGRAPTEYRRPEPPTEPEFRGGLVEAAHAAIRVARRMEDAVETIERRRATFGAEEDSDVWHAQLREQALALRGVRCVLERLTGPKTHHLKSDHEPFVEVLEGRKPYEVRRFDRPYAAGDTLVLMEHDRATGKYSGRQIVAEVTCITGPGSYGLPSDVGVLGIRVTKWQT